MHFDIRASLFNPDGECDEQAFEAYVDTLLAQFERSPEAQGLDDPSWLSIVLALGRGYCARTAWELTPGDLDEILFELFPRKVSCSPSEAPVVLAEVRAFLRYLDRAYAKPDAGACLAFLDADSESRLAAYLGDSSHYGLAKSFLMGGEEAGFDMTTEQGINTWMLEHNAALAGAERPARSQTKAKTKARKRQQKAARRKNRKRR